MAQNRNSYKVLFHFHPLKWQSTRSLLKKYRTLVVSSDPAHTLSDAFKLSNSTKYDNIEPIQMREIVPNLHAPQVDPIIEIKEQYSDIRVNHRPVIKVR